MRQHFYPKCSCPDAPQCAIHSLMKEGCDAIVTILEKVTVAGTVTTPAGHP